MGDHEAAAAQVMPVCGALTHTRLPCQCVG
jgi:hypothetical protein